MDGLVPACHTPSGGTFGVSLRNEGFLPETTAAMMMRERRRPACAAVELGDEKALAVQMMHFSVAAISADFIVEKKDKTGR